MCPSSSFTDHHARLGHYRHDLIVFGTRDTFSLIGMVVTCHSARPWNVSLQLVILPGSLCIEQITLTQWHGVPPGGLFLQCTQSALHYVTSRVDGLTSFIKVQWSCIRDTSLPLAAPEFSP